MKLAATLLLAALLSACYAPGRAPDPLAALEAIPADLAARGPIAWLDHFEPGDAFFMASEGALALESHDHAREVVSEFAALVDTIELRWIDPRIEWRGDDVVSFVAGYDEDLVYVDGRPEHWEGYVSGVMRRVGDRWLLADVHWSMPIDR